MSTDEDGYLDALEHGPIHLFTMFNHAGIPDVAAGVYTIWRGRSDRREMPDWTAGEFVYVGYAGRGLTRERISAMREAGKRKKALWSRLHAHSTGRRSGHQFAVYVADRFVLPRLTAEQIADVAQNRLPMDLIVKQYIWERLAFRWIEVPDGPTAIAVEARIQRGDWTPGRPLLNPA